MLMKEPAKWCVADVSGWACMENDIDNYYVSYLNMLDKWVICDAAGSGMPLRDADGDTLQFDTFDDMTEYYEAHLRKN